MSFQAMTWAIEQKLPCTQKMVLLMLANCCNHHTGKCVPKIKTLAEECGLSESAAKNAIKSLADAKLIEIVHRFYEGVQLSNSYVLLMEGWVTKKPRVGQEKTPVGQDIPTEPGKEPGSETIPPTPKGEEPIGFAKFWNAWPSSIRKQSKGKCLEAWKKNRTELMAEVILIHIQRLIESKEWLKNGGEFIPAPLVYLNQRRWEGAETDAQTVDPFAGAI